MRIHKRELVLALVAVFAITALYSLVGGRISTLTVYSDGCSGLINSSGYWEFSPNLSCVNSSGVNINSSDVILDCKNNFISGNLSSNLSLYGIQVGVNKTNVSIWNCNISSFNVSIIIGLGGNVSLTNTSATGNNFCVDGNWSDVSGNRGCFDIRGPVITVSNQSIYKNQSLSYQIVASDVSGIGSYYVNASEFNISSSGILSNVSALNVGNYMIMVFVNDTKNYSSNSSMNIQVNEVPSSNQDSGNNSDSDSDSDDDSDDDVQIPVSAKCANEWVCTSWSACINGSAGRSCTNPRPNCNVGKPEAKRTCTANESVGCVERWSCNWEACINSTQAASSCTDLNACNTTLSKPSSKSCVESNVSSTESRPRRFFAGLAIFDIQGKRNKLFVYFAILAVVVLLIFFLVRAKLKARRLTGR